MGAHFADLLGQHRCRISRNAGTRACAGLRKPEVQPRPPHFHGLKAAVAHRDGRESSPYGASNLRPNRGDVAAAVTVLASRLEDMRPRTGGVSRLRRDGARRRGYHLRPTFGDDDAVAGGERWAADSKDHVTGGSRESRRDGIAPVLRAHGQGSRLRIRYRSGKPAAGPIPDLGLHTCTCVSSPRAWLERHCNGNRSSSGCGRPDCP